MFNAFQDHCVCLLSTVDEDGAPNVSPKGSMIVYDDDHLAYWERSKKNALKNLQANPKVAVIYSNKAAFFNKEIPFVGGIIRFFGTAKIHESGELGDQR
ncbi:MAG: pyridoxamine 5'-phosphate oxidase family protein [Rhodospirillales bacterium]